VAYQRFGDDSDLYVWMSDIALNIWIAHFEPKTKTVRPASAGVNGITTLVFDESNVDEAAMLLQALYDHLRSQDRIVEINKKTGDLKIRKAKKNG
jgi:DNA-directed RNA polymerase specialized sigma24 family protein